MKKLLTLALAVIMVMSMTTMVFAADTEIGVDTAQTAQTLVTYGVQEGYTVTIPDAVVIDTATTKGTAVIKAENVMIAHGAVLNIKVSGHDYDDAWVLIDTADDTNTLEYVIGSTDGASDIVNNSVVLSCDAGDSWDSVASQTMYFALNEDVEKSGSYEDTLTFSVSID